MGYYVQGPTFGKAQFLVEQHGGQILPTPPKTLADLPEGKGLVVVVDNGIFEAAAFAFNEGEYQEFSYPDDLRPKTYVVADRTKLEELTRYKG